MRGITCLAAVALAAAALFGVAGTAVAVPRDPGVPPISVVPSDPNGRTGAPSVGVGVRDGGATGSPAGQRGGTDGQRGGAAAVCTWVAAPDMEAWIRRLPSNLPGGGTDRIAATSRLYSRVCGGVNQGWSWLGPADAAGEPALPAPGELAQEAYAQLRLPVPTPEHSPDLRLADGRPAVLVGEQTWLWTDRSRFQPQSRRLQVGPVWAQVTATPVGLSFDPGDGEPVESCAGPGTPFVAGRDRQHAASPTCGYLYEQSSAQQPGGVVSAEYGITWRVSWTGASGATPAGGQLPEMTSRTTAVFAVAEAQALGTRQVRR